jgi:hypothetical protein
MEHDIGALVERLDRLERENSRIRRSVRLMKLAIAPAIAFCIAISAVPQALSKDSGRKEISARQINLVSEGGAVLASLGTTADGNVLTFFDSSGRKTMTIGDSADGTFAGIATYDGNSIFAGTGKPRTSFGEANASNVTGGGFGFAVFDPSGSFKVRAAAGTTPDATIGFFETIDPNGSAAGITDDDKTFHDQGFFANDLNGKNRVFAGNSLDGTTFNNIQTVDPNSSTAGIFDGGGSQGFFANDLNGKNRVFAGNSLDGTTFNQISFGDSKGNFEGLLGFNPLLSPATTLFLSEPSGFFSVGETSDGHGIGWFLVDASNTLRMIADFDGANETIDEFSPSSVLVGHLP